MNYGDRSLKSKGLAPAVLISHNRVLFLFVCFLGGGGVSFKRERDLFLRAFTVREILTHTLNPGSSEQMLTGCLEMQMVL